MKKFITAIVLFLFSFGLFGQNLTYSYEESDLTEDLKYYQDELNKTAKGKAFVQIADSIVDKYKTNEEFLSILFDKLLYIDTSSFDDTTAYFIEYFYYKVYILLSEIEELKLNEVLTLNINDVDKKLAEEKVLALQGVFYEKIQNYFEEYSLKLEEYLNVKETGDLKINFELNDIFSSETSNSKFEFELSDYEAVSKSFDSSKISGDIDVLLEASSEDEIVKLQFSSFLDFILKDGGMYIKLSDLNISNKENLGEFEEFFTKLEDFAKQNKYIKYEDYSSQTVINLLKSVDYKSAFSDFKVALEKPLFEAYKKEGDKYYLRPTIYACENFKKLENRFDPFNGVSCSDNQYKKLLSTFQKDFGKIYLSVNDKKTTLGFEGYTGYDIEENNGYISFENNEIVEYYYSLKPSQEYYPGEYFKIQFKDKKLTGGLVFSGGSYDYQTGEYVDEIYNFGLTGTGLEDFKLDYKGYVVNGKEFLTGVFSITGKSFGFSYKLDDSLTKADVVVSGNLDYENILDNLNLNVDVQKRLGKYDYDTWEYEVDDNFSKVFNSKVIINSKNINGQATFYSLGEVVANLTTNGNYTKNTGNLNINVDFSEKFSKSLFWKDDDNHKIVGILELSADSSSNKNNFYIILDVSDNGKTIIKYEIENVGEKYIDNNAQIEVPTDVIELEGLYYGIN